MRMEPETYRISRFPPSSRGEKCPRCGAPVLPLVDKCSSCGADLSRADMMSSVKPVSRRRRARRVLSKTLTLIVILGIPALIAAGGLPAVEKRYPLLGGLHRTARVVIQRAWSWGRGLVATQEPEAPQQASSPPIVTPEKSSATVPPATPSPKVAPSELYIVVKSTPPGAQVHLNATIVGVTPLTIDRINPGTYEVKLVRAGYASVSQTVKVESKPLTLDVILATQEPAVKPAAPKAAPAPAPRRPQGVERKPLAVGASAPEFVLKDRFGVLHSLNDFRGRQTSVLFVWRLDAQAQRAIKELDLRIRNASPAQGAVVIVMQPDRVAVRTFIAAGQIKIPIVFGTSEVAAKYGVPQDIAVLFVVSERGIIQRRQP